MDGSHSHGSYPARGALKADRDHSLCCSLFSAILIALNDRLVEVVVLAEAD